MHPAQLAVALGFGGGFSVMSMAVALVLALANRKQPPSLERNQAMLFTTTWLKDAAERAVKTFAQAALGARRPRSACGASSSGEGN